MGYTKHHAIVVSSWDADLLKSARVAAVALDLCVSNSVDGTANGYASFLVAPDGSKEGWASSDKGDDRRGEFIEFLKGKSFEDGSTALAWVELSFNDDYGPPQVLRESTKDNNKIESCDDDIEKIDE